MKIIIVGDGKVGFTLAEHLSREEHDVTIIDTSDNALQKASDTLDVMCIKGNGASLTALKEAGADTADLLIAVTNLDEVNMVCCLTGKRLGAKYTIARVRNFEYTAAQGMLKMGMGIDLLINPENDTAVEISRILRFPSAANIETFYRGRVELMSFRAREEDFFIGQPLSALSRKVRDLPILFCAAERNEEVLIPDGSFVPQVGDKLYLIGAPLGLHGFFELMGRYAPKIRNVFVVGGGRITFYLAALMERMNMKVTIVERKEERCRQLSELLPHTLVINGDGTDQRRLRGPHRPGRGQPDHLSLRPAEGAEKGGGQVQPPELHRHRPAPGDGQRHLPQAHHRWAHPSGGPGDAKLQGQRDERPVPHR